LLPSSRLSADIIDAEGGQEQQNVRQGEEQANVVKHLPQYHPDVPANMPHGLFYRKDLH